MTDSTERAANIHEKIEDDLRGLGGLLRCEVCGNEKSLERMEQRAR